MADLPPAAGNMLYISPPSPTEGEHVTHFTFVFMLLYNRKLLILTYGLAPVLDLDIAQSVAVYNHRFLSGVFPLRAAQSALTSTDHEVQEV